MKKLTLFVLAVFMVLTPLVAQSSDEMVTVPKKYVSTEGLNHQAAAAPAPTEVVSKWIGVGKEVGIATREGLNAVVDTAEKFGSTKVGNFVMVMIAWRIIGKDVLGVILGVPMLIGGICLWLWAARRMFFGYRVLEKKEGHTKFYKDHEPIEFASSDARATAGAFMGISLAAWVLICLFAVIF